MRVRVTYDRLYVELQLKRSVKVPLWSQEKEKSTGKDRNSVELNHYIDALRVKFYQIYQDLELEGKIISARAIVNRYQGKDETFKTLYNVFKEHNDNCRKLIGTDYADITVRRYDNCLKYLMELVKRDYKIDDILLREVNGELVRKFDLYLKTEKHCAQNTVIRYMKCFKKVINLAIANEWLTKNPFAGIKFHEVEVNKQFLSQAEINRIWQKEFKIERLELVRDVFIFCVYTGLAFIDVYNLHPEHISEDGNGNLWIVKPREKTNNLCNIPLLSIPKQILEKYKDVDGEQKRLDFAKRMGAEKSVNFKDFQGIDALAQGVKDAFGGHAADFAFQCTGSPVAHANIYKFIRNGGGLCELGFFINGGDATINPHFDLCSKEIILVGSWVYTLRDYATTFDFLKRAKAIGLPMDDLITHEFPLEQINEAHQTNLAMKGLKIAIINK